MKSLIIVESHNDKYFIEKLHIFEIDPNSDASELLELESQTKDNPEWFDDKLRDYLLSNEEVDFSDWAN